MIVKEMKPGLEVMGAVQENLRIFAGDAFTDSGLMTNSYLLEYEGALIVLGSLPADYLKKWAEKIAARSGGKKIYFVSFCQRSDKRALELLNASIPDICVIGSAVALYTLDTKQTAITIRGKKTLELGGGKLTFSSRTGGNLFVSWDAQNILFSGNAYGSFCAYQSLLLSEIKDKRDYHRGAENFRREHPLTWDIPDAAQILCPAYGPIVDNIGELAGIYTERYAPASKAVIVTDGSIFASTLEKHIIEGLTDSEIDTMQCIDLRETSRDEVLLRIAGADSVLFGFSGTAPKAVLDIVTSLKKRDCKEKLAACFVCAHNSQQENGLRQLLEPLGFNLSVSDFFCVGRPDETTEKAAYEYGFSFGCSQQRIPNPRAPKLVKCLVCGEIFDASLGICPVCGVGLDQCVPAEEEPISYKKDTDLQYLILGSGIAAVSAAEAIRKRDKTGVIQMISAETTLPINRPMLTKDMQMAIFRPEEMLIHDQKWYEERSIELHLGQYVTKIDLKKKSIQLENGIAITYDRLIYALGGACFVPPFKGADKKGVLTIRDLQDVNEISAYAKQAKTAVVIGGGVLGLEAAGELQRLGLKVTVLEASPQICGRQIDRKSADAFISVMARMGVPCYEDVSIEEICGEDAVTGVRLADGRMFAGDIVIVSCGTAANVALAKNAGLSAGRAVIVDQHMRTSEEDIYACGDCASYDGINYQLWAEASEQGKVAGANAAGDSISFVNKALGFSLAAFGASLYAIGDVGKSGTVLKTVEMTDSVRNKAESYWFHGGRLEGAIIFNKPEKVDKVTTAVNNHARYDELFG